MELDPREDPEGHAIVTKNKEVARSIKVVALAQVGMFAVLAAMIVVGLILLSGIHKNLCSFKENIKDQRDQSQEILDMTLKERIEKFGPQIGSIPEQYIQSQLAARNATLNSLKGLDCE